MARKKKIIDLRISLPTKWAELTAMQVTHLCYLLAQSLERTELLLRFALYCAEIKPHGSKVVKGDIVRFYYKRGVGNIPLDASQMSAVVDAVAWVLDEPALMQSPYLGKSFATPDNRLFSVSLEKYLLADAAYSRYLISRDLEHVRVMVAALYVDAPYSDKIFERLLNRANMLRAWELSAVALWWLSVKKFLTEKYSYVFKVSEGGEGGSGGGDCVETMFDILSALNDGRIADNEIIRKSDVHEAFHSLNSKAKAAVEAKNRK